MCTFLLFVLISRLANGLNMGNKTSRPNTSTSSGYNKGLQSIFSEEDYIPMSRSMRKSLLKDKKFHRVLPSRVNLNRIRSGQMILDFEKVTVKDVDTKKEESENSNTQLDNSSVPECINSSGKVTFQNCANVSPIVAIVCSTETDEKSKSLPNAQVDEEHKIGVYSSFSSPRKSHVTNRKYSLIDMRTGIKKSRFTLDLENRLRKSKLELGFDTHLSGWKEFSYKLGPHSYGRRRLSLERAMQDNMKNVENNENSTEYENSTVKDGTNESVPYYTHNCQILGLCSVGRTQVFPNKTECKYTVCEDELRLGDNVNNLIDNHVKKDGCHCDLCTLAYLTDMNSHDERTIGMKYKSRNSTSSSDKNNRPLKEKILITDTKNGKKSIEISVRSASPDNESGVLSNCSCLSTEISRDCTSSRIRNMFKENDLPDVREIYTNPNSTYNDISIDKLLSISKENFKISSSTTNFFKTTSNANQSPIKVRSGKNSPSTMTGSFTSTSSLSTIMSYNRVRHIFQTIIEGTRTRKRKRLDVHKFKEMEDLGLGKFINNHWYPSDHKAFSIWKDMHDNVQGLEGEFKKYQKTMNKT